MPPQDQTNASELDQILHHFTNAVKDADKGIVDWPKMLSSNMQAMRYVSSLIITFCSESIVYLPEERRKALIEIIRQYGSLLQKARQLVTPLKVSCDKIRYNLMDLLEIWRQADELDPSVGIAKIVKIELPKIDIQSTDELMAECLDLIKKLHSEQEEIEKCIKTSKKLKNLLVGLTVVSIVIIIATSVTGGLALAGVGMFAGVAVATEATATAAFSLSCALPVAIGCFTGAGVLTAGGVALGLTGRVMHQLKSNLKKLQNNYTEVVKNLEKDQLGFSEISHVLIKLTTSQEELEKRLRWEEFRCNTTHCIITDSQKHNDELHETLEEFEKDLKQQITDYSNRLIPFISDLKRTSAGCVLL